MDDQGHVVLERVAVKKISDYRCSHPRENVDAEKYLRRVCREIDILIHFKPSALIVEIQDLYVSRNEEDLYIVMPYVDLSWDKLMRLPENVNLRNALAEKEIKWMMCQLMMGLQALHRSGCMHRDLSLANVLLNKSTFNCFIADFGLSRVQFDANRDISLDGAALPYRAPEVLMECSRYNHKVDVWSAGCIMMELMTKRPFIAEKDSLHQLWLIMDLFGYPDLTCWDDLHMSRRAMSYLQIQREKLLQGGNSTRELPMAKDIGTFLKAKCPAATDECADVLRAMLVLHPQGRASVEDVLKMPWFADDEHCRQAIETAGHQHEHLGECPDDTETMKYKHLDDHMRSNLWSFTKTKVVGSQVM